MKWKKIAALGLVGLVGLTGFGYAYQGAPGVPGPNCTVDEDIRTSLQNAIDSGDYEAFQSIREEYNIAKGRIFTIIDTPEEFELFTELHDAVQTGDIEKAMEIREALGLPIGGAHASGPMDGTGNQFRGRGPHMAGPRNGNGNVWGGQ